MNAKSLPVLAAGLVVGAAAGWFAANGQSANEEVTTDASGNEVVEVDAQVSHAAPEVKAVEEDVFEAAQPEVQEELVGHEAKITAMIKRINPMISIRSIDETSLEGIYQVVLGSGEIFHADAEGTHFIVGELYTTGPTGLVNLTEQGKTKDRLPLLASIDDTKAIIYPALGEKKGRVTIFTDVHCGYCRKVHKEVPALTKAGVEVRYLAYPREGIINPQTHQETATYSKMQSIWCSKDQQKAMTDVKNQLYIPEEKCENPIAEQLELGRKLGVNGTPAMFLDDGTLIPGYVEAAQLIQRMGLN